MDVNLSQEWLRIIKRQELAGYAPGNYTAHARNTDKNVKHLFSKCAHKTRKFNILIVFYFYLELKLAHVNEL